MAVPEQVRAIGLRGDGDLTAFDRGPIDRDLGVRVRDFNNRHKRDKRVEACNRPESNRAPLMRVLP